jgi:N-methylhydantoinase B
MFDTMAAGFGAHVDTDGQDTGGIQLISQGRSPDAEMTEFLHPLLLLWRREEIDTGGPGRMRGGVSGTICAVSHRTSVPMALVFSGAGKATSQNVGLAGGYPGCTQLDLIVRDSAVVERLAAGIVPTSVAELGGLVDVMPCEGESTLSPSDALYLRWQSGGGYGDPLGRTPAQVLADVTSGHVSAAAANDIYGVVLADDHRRVNDEATSARRSELIDLRLGRSRRLRADQASDAADGGQWTHACRLDDNLAVVERDGQRVVACSHCGQHLGEPGGGYQEGLLMFEGSPGEAGPHVWPDPSTYVDGDVVFRQLCCPGCATAMLSTVVPADHPMATGGPELLPARYAH